MSPTATIEAAPSQPWALRASLNQKPKIVHVVQVRRSRGVTSESMLDQVPSSAKVDGCLGSFQPESVLFCPTSVLTLWTRRCRYEESFEVAVVDAMMPRNTV